MVLSIPDSDPYWLLNAQVPHCFLDEDQWRPRTAENLVLVDVQIAAGTIAQIMPAGTGDIQGQPGVDLRQGQVWPCFVDLHTHLDKGHIWNRAPNPDGTFTSALATVQQDARFWQPEDLYHRMVFGLKCSYAHGTQAIRTHLDCGQGLAEVSLDVFQELQQQWADRLTLQAVCLVPLDYFLTPAGEKLADRIADLGGVLGGLPLMGPDLDRQLERVFALARERNLGLDFHVDESNNPQDRTLRAVADVALRHPIAGEIVCGHACSLAVQPPVEAAATIARVGEAGIGIVSLPLCNLFLQDRQLGRTPRWRGVTMLQELKAGGVPVALASDNCRDPFYGFGDHDLLEVFTRSVQIAHLDQPYGDWPHAITRTPAELMGLPDLGRIRVGLAADLILFQARYFSELLSRPQADRVVLRRGRPIDTTLPDYAELDPWVIPR
ncbi:cytosine deaminase [Leptolyngbya sp. 'hensonii']|uniref:cytosine deaminase n=1 Tax=Leptolyngbya sp. 'hensonii' TaxID=1922337 RepID=UPI0009501F0E|nr:cytosine deaminase [Leptolyngbya sp. 'hensonii']OLP17644.1 cytosine deaminase [Leptolyngbya sp. 'hensonii']